MSELYEPIGKTQCDCSYISLQEASIRIGPAVVYDLNVHPSSVPYTRDLLRKISANVRYNPFAPYINLIQDSRLSIFEWFLSANGKAYGSRGAS